MHSCTFGSDVTARVWHALYVYVQSRVQWPSGGRSQEADWIERPDVRIAEFPPDRWCSIYESVVPVHFWHLNETSNSRKGGFKRSLTTKRLSSTRSSTVSSTSSRISGALRNGIQGKTPAMIFRSYGRWCQKHCSRFRVLLSTVTTNIVYEL
jgi:hypothetical protein